MEKGNNHSVEIIRYTISPEKQNNFEEAYLQAGNYLKASPYCLSYEVIRGTEEPNHYIIIICWTSVDEHLNGFRKSPEFMPFFNLVKPFYASIGEMKHYEATGNSWTRE